MGTSHHGTSSQFSEELRQQLIDAGEVDEAEIRRRFVDQVTGREKREYPHGRVGADDDGALSYAVGPDPNGEIIRIEFGKPVEWIGLPPREAIELAQSLIKHARAISKEPVVVKLN
jgi:hypothetical protein